MRHVHTRVSSWNETWACVHRTLVMVASGKGLHGAVGESMRQAQSTALLWRKRRKSGRKVGSAALVRPSRADLHALRQALAQLLKRTADARVVLRLRRKQKTGGRCEGALTS